MLACMTPDQFQAICKLLRIRSGSSKRAAELVLVHGHRKSESARTAGCTPHAVGQVVRRIEAGIELARAAVGVGTQDAT